MRIPDRTETDVMMIATERVGEAHRDFMVIELPPPFPEFRLPMIGSPFFRVGPQYIKQRAKGNADIPCRRVDGLGSKRRARRERGKGRRQ